MDNVLHLLGIARKAGRVEVGEEPVGASARARQARLILVASDAADNSARRAAHFAQAGKAPWFRVPYTKGELGGTVGRASCAMLALTDVGLAAALLARLAAGAPETYGAASAELSEKADKALQRQKEQRRHEKKLQKGGRKPWAAPPARKESPPEPAGKRTLPRGSVRFPAGSGGDSFRAGGAAHGFLPPFCSFFSWRRCSFWRWRALSAFSLSSADAAP